MLKREKMAARGRSNCLGEDIIPTQWFDEDAAPAEPDDDNLWEESALPLQWFNEEESETDEPCEETALLLQWLYEDEPGAPASEEPESEEPESDDSWEEGIGPCLERLGLGLEHSGTDVGDSWEGGSWLISRSDALVGDTWEPGPEEEMLLALDHGNQFGAPVVSAH